MPVFGRSITPFVRTARSALQLGNSVNPLHNALRRQNAVAFVNATRSYAAVYERTKPHVNIGMYGTRLLLNTFLTLKGTIGHVDHGKVSPAFSIQFNLTNHPRLP